MFFCVTNIIMTYENCFDFFVNSYKVTHIRQGHFTDNVATVQMPTILRKRRMYFKSNYLQATWNNPRSFILYHF